MAASPADIRYWDACAFLGYFREEKDIVGGCADVLEAADRGQVQLVTSSLTIAEVLHIKGEKALEKQRRETVELFFMKPLVAVRAVTRRDAELAQALYWDHRIKPKDAIHVATALRAGIEVFETKDQGLLKKSILRFEGYASLTLQLPHMKTPTLGFPPPERTGD